MSKRTAPLREPSPFAAPPPQLLHDMLQVHEGLRQLSAHFHQAKAMHSLQVRATFFFISPIISANNHDAPQSDCTLCSPYCCHLSMAVEMNPVASYHPPEVHYAWAARP